MARVDACNNNVCMFKICGWDNNELINGTNDFDS